jgi:hypothetical protein
MQMKIIAKKLGVFKYIVFISVFTLPHDNIAWHINAELQAQYQNAALVAQVGVHRE